MLNIFSKLIDANQREVKRLANTVREVNSLEPKIKKLTDSQIKSKSEELRKKAQSGEDLNKLLPEAFALIREAAFRSLGQRHFDVQLISAAALHEGKIAEQRTGEGKTLSATPAVFLNALTGKGVHVITVNDYLARRDAGWMGPIYHMLGVSVAVIVHDAAYLYDPKYSAKDVSDKRLKHLKPVFRKEAYYADITYGTNNEFGFDYLRDNMALSLENQNQRGHFYAIVDEVDSILIDEARTPLIISAPAQEATDKYIQFTKIIDKLSADTDYVIDEKLRTAHLTEHGTLKIEKILGVDNLYEKDFSSLHHMEEALKAKTLFQIDKDYVVKDGEVIIVDEFTGRLMPGRRYSEGLHQAIEAKEGVQIQQESQTLATISFQNYFRMYEKLAGMTGTAATEAEEFHKIYKLDVIIVPTNMDMIRIDDADAIYKTIGAKYSAVAAEIEKIHATGQPVLVGTTSIEKNEFLSDLLKKKKISHALLNAKNHEKEAEIIADAGAKGAVTVATNMAGRGVDIQLAKGVAELGGLYVIGTERHESRRIDNQLRGRSGRQGDPGVSKFFVSLEDDLMRIFGGDQVAKVMNFLKMPEDVPIENPLVSKAIEGAQKKVEGHNFDIRKHTVEYDDVMNQQRQIIYGVRKQILEATSQSSVVSRQSSDSLKEQILEKVDKEIEGVVLANSQDGVDFEKIVEDMSTIVPFDDKSKIDLQKQVEQLNSEHITEFLIKLARDLYGQREKQVGEDISRQMETFVYLNTIDTLWIEHLDTMDDLRAGIGLRGYAQRDPLVEYKKEGFDLFERLLINVDSEVVHRIFKVSVEHRHPIAPQPVVDLDKALEEHEEALDEKTLMEEVGQLMPQVEETRDKIQDTNNGETKVVVEGSSNDAAYSTPEPSRHSEQVLESVPDVVVEQPSPTTKVTVERGGQVVAQQVYREDGGLQQNKIGRNDPCPCGSGLKWKKCHLNREPQG
ncbi:preprotein translocase subunit SecA [Candidatus Daviesbacteria bacterium RIFCSPHIGHO2_01_FULL_36_37]|uniref:Protein translocase subunit SecA n=3 Tax=Candidatus Daviesiibacteriota TaxID=1752718 RepID=A0A1F5K1J9_9BACT|nr:MAG: Protein translocase subunit SecA [Candidatus Daviesbacteria bacterium GW2011_GWA1_36_8]OGE16679.1 MAG: preprotein translocase subunit SecA [Candidatus Daviesbacteria bacterium RIFCSPHIGHO2_01_FULL_36_37]OGE31640.1 MAG: preprotein translocase subunit SecA [Candidatus Daviesbacteria bacterium RIFCSPHIGHO2_02_FULL_37_9]OGE34756.1 MAG: preprotein translocase subunit SecA [Candidatus Daviesbacteria bacterium RIFCSPHIGHO2_12_FULL_37_16]